MYITSKKQIFCGVVFCIFLGVLVEHGTGDLMHDLGYY